MYSNRSEHSHSRPYNERGSRQWDVNDDRWEWHEPHRDVQCDPQHKHDVDGHGSIQRTSRIRGYSDSPKRLYSKDSLNRERSRKSPVRRRMSSPDWDTSENKRRRFTESDEEDYRHGRVLEDKASRLSPDSFSHAHISKDFKRILSQEEDFKYRKATQASRHRYPHKESTQRKQYDDLSCRQSSGYYMDRDGHERSRDHSPGRTRPQDHSVKYCESDVVHDVVHQSVADPEQRRSTKGFQRFLDVLNKGVNMTVLNKIMTQTSTEVEDQPQSPSSFMNTADHSWSPSCTGRQQGSYQTTSHWSESKGSPRRASPTPERRSLSPNGCSLPEKSLQRGDGAKPGFSSNGRCVSPSGAEKMTLTPEDEHKHKHMQDVLQAIGMNLGFEELGQMSHRIQERLYGKRDGDGDRQISDSRERDTLQAFSPKPQGSLSSSRSNFSPANQKYYTKDDSYSAQREVTGVHQIQVDQTIEYDQNSNSSILQESEKCETKSQQSTAACQAFSQSPIYTLSEPFVTPVTSMYSPVNCSPLLYSALPPNLRHVGPRLFLPRQPPLLPHPRVPSLNIFPAVLTQTRHLFPQHNGNQSIFNLPIQPLNTTQKPKTLSRPRCLQVIETKQTG